MHVENTIIIAEIRQNVKNERSFFLKCAACGTFFLNPFRRKAEHRRRGVRTETAEAAERMDGPGATTAAEKAPLRPDRGSSPERAKRRTNTRSLPDTL